MSNIPVGKATEETTNNITLLTKVISLCTMAYCVFSFYRGVVNADSTQVFVSVAVLMVVLVSCKLLERLCNDRVKLEQ
jgi:hypothetical protein